MIRLVTALLCGLALTALAAPSAPTIAEFLAEPEFLNPKLSPDGKFVGVRGTRKFKDFFALIEIDKMKAGVAVTFPDSSLTEFWWKSPEWVVFELAGADRTVVYRSYHLPTKKFSELGNFNRRSGAGIVSMLPDDPEGILAATPTNTGIELRRLDVRTGKSVIIQPDIGFVQDWFIDRRGVALAALKNVDEEWSILVRPDAKSPWLTLPQGRRDRPDLRPVALHPDRPLLIATGHRDSDRMQAWFIDLKTGAAELAAQHEALDVTGIHRWNDEAGGAREIYFTQQAAPSVFLNAADGRIATMIDSALPEARNTIVSTIASNNRMIIWSLNAEGLGSYWLFDRQAGSLSPLGSPRPALEQVARGPYATRAFTSRDGLPLRVHAWLPAPSPHGPPPAILVLRSYLTDFSEVTLDPAFEHLRALGYAILMADTRGSRGFGLKLEQAGEGQIHAGIPDDYAEALQQAIAAGWIDAKRVALHSSGPGGIVGPYLLQRHAGLFRVWLNNSTPLRRGAIADFVLRFGPLERDSGDYADPVKNRLRAYRTTLVLEDVVAKIDLPSFHAYWDTEFVPADAATLQRRLRKTSVPHEFFVRETDDTSRTTAERRETAARRALAEHTALAAFLGKHLPVR